MASTRKQQTKDGREYYEIRVRMPDRHELSTRWYIPDGLSQKTIQRELNRQIADFERKCESGEALTKREQQEKKRAAQLAAAQIQTVKEYAEKVYIPSKAVVNSKGTMRVYNQHFQTNIFPAIGDMKITDVTPAQLSALVLSMQDKKLAIKTVSITYGILRNMFDLAYRTDVVSTNPMLKVIRPKARKDEKAKSEGPAYYTQDEINRMKECLELEPLKWQCYFRILIETGIREGEACALRWSDIDLSTGTVDVTATIVFLPKGESFRGPTKSGKTRIVYIGTKTLALLKLHLAEQMKGQRAEYIFTAMDGKTPLSPHSAISHAKIIGKKYGFESMHPHKLRHSWATNARLNGMDMFTVSKLLGHSTMAITANIYSHADEEAQKQAAQHFLTAMGQNT